MKSTLTLDYSERLRVLRDGAVNYAPVASGSLLGIVLVPLMLKALGQEAYGLWLSTLALIGIARLCEPGLSWIIISEVARWRGCQTKNGAQELVTAARDLYVIIGSVVSVIVCALAFKLGTELHLSAQAEGVLPYVCVLLALSLFADFVLAFPMSTLYGLRRFAFANVFEAGMGLLRSAGMLFLVLEHGDLIGFAAWHSAVSVISAVIGIVAVNRLEPRLNARSRRSGWHLLCKRLSFGLNSAVMNFLGTLMWQAPRLLIGIISGAPFVAQYQVGQKFPMTLGSVIERVTQPIFPATTERAAAGDSEGIRELLDTGTRSMLVFALPACLILWLEAPNLLAVWTGQSTAEAVTVFRLTSAAMLAEAVGASAHQVLWGADRATTALAIVLGMALVTLTLTPLLLAQIGIAGAAWGFLAGLTFGACAFLVMACRICQARPYSIMREGVRGLELPLVACLAVGVYTPMIIPAHGWAGVIASGVAPLIAFVSCLWLWGAREEERQFILELVRMPANVARRTATSSRRVAARVASIGMRTVSDELN